MDDELIAELLTRRADAAGRRPPFPRLLRPVPRPAGLRRLKGRYVEHGRRVLVAAGHGRLLGSLLSLMPEWCPERRSRGSATWLILGTRRGLMPGQFLPG